MRAREATDHSASGRKASSAKQPKNKKDIRSPRMASLPPERRQTDPPHGYKQTPPTDHASAASETEIGGGGSSFCKCVSVEAPARAAHSGTLSITRGLLYARGGGAFSPVSCFFSGDVFCFWGVWANRQTSVRAALGRRAPLLMFRRSQHKKECGLLSILFERRERSPMISSLLIREPSRSTWFRNSE